MYGKKCSLWQAVRTLQSPIFEDFSTLGLFSSGLFTIGLFESPLYHHTFHQLALITLHVSKRSKSSPSPLSLSSDRRRRCRRSRRCCSLRGRRRSSTEADYSLRRSRPTFRCPRRSETSPLRAPRPSCSPIGEAFVTTNNFN